MVIDLGVHESISVIQIDWAEPYASSYEVQYWASEKKNGDSAENPLHLLACIPQREAVLQVHAP